MYWLRPEVTGHRVRDLPRGMHLDRSGLGDATLVPPELQRLVESADRSRRA
jgi:hypothetical protein